MTNGEKYLKDGVDIEEFLNAIPRGEITAWISDYGTCISMEGLKEWLNQSVKPTLTEDEQVILRHINTTNIDRIGRHDCGDLILLFKSGGFYLMTTNFNFDGLFQFIQPRRRI